VEAPFAIYADSESLIKKLNKLEEMNKKIEKLSKNLNKTKEEVEKYESYTIKLQRHQTNFRDIM
jgi:ABC-type Fe3+-citrate transport system substrate-binding protein